MKNRLLLISLASKLPVFVQRIPYFLALKIIHFYLKLSIPLIEHIWPRHSYNYTYFVAGLSDLDLTIIYKRKPMPYEQAKLINIISNLKKIIPFLGEINIFTPDLINNLKHFTNKYEIQRDQKTLNYYKIDLNSPNDRVQALVFLLKVVHSNINKLTLGNHLRLNKWQYYLLLITNKSYPVTEKNLLDVIENQVNNILKSLEFNNISINSLLKEEMDTHQVFVLCPSKWISDSFYLGNFNLTYQNEINQLTENEALIILYQFRWDIFGIASQIHCYNPREVKDMSNYINRILFIGQEIGGKFLSEEYKELNHQIRFLDSYLLPFCLADSKIP